MWAERGKTSFLLTDRRVCRGVVNDERGSQLFKARRIPREMARTCVFHEPKRVLGDECRRLQASRIRERSSALLGGPLCELGCGWNLKKSVVKNRKKDVFLRRHLRGGSKRVREGGWEKEEGFDLVAAEWMALEPQTTVQKGGGCAWEGGTGVDRGKTRPPDDAGPNGQRRLFSSDTS